MVTAAHETDSSSKAPWQLEQRQPSYQLGGKQAVWGGGGGWCTGWCKVNMRYSSP